jgi:uncharacterized membrane protein YqhA
VTGWVRWLVIAVCVVLVVVLIAYARGDRQRGETESAAAVSTVSSDRAAVA